MVEPRAMWLSLTFLLALAGCLRHDEHTVIKLGHALDVSHPVHQGMVYMAERAAALSDGRLRIDIYPSQQLCSERECVELLQIGSLGMTKASAAIMENFAPSFRALNLPYVFRDEAHRFGVLDGDIGAELLRAGEPRRLLGLAFYDAGSRSFYTTRRPVRTPADLRGMKIRVQESATAVLMVRALGGSPTPIAFGEIYTALQQGVVDGAENNPPSFLSSRHYEVARYYTLDEHTATPDVLVISTVVWNRLSREEQRWLRQAAADSVPVQRERWRAATDDALRQVEEAGVTIVRPDKALFAQGVEGMLDAYRGDEAVDTLLRRIQAVQ
jgi:tripartite ATP-independent transporter DctP family solute receptor